MCRVFLLCCVQRFGKISNKSLLSFLDLGQYSSCGYPRKICIQNKGFLLMVVRISTYWLRQEQSLLFLYLLFLFCCRRYILIVPVSIEGCYCVSISWNKSPIIRCNLIKGKYKQYENFEMKRLLW